MPSVRLRGQCETPSPYERGPRCISILGSPLSPSWRSEASDFDGASLVVDRLTMTPAHVRDLVREPPRICCPRATSRVVLRTSSHSIGRESTKQPSREFPENRKVGGSTPPRVYLMNGSVSLPVVTVGDVSRGGCGDGGEGAKCCLKVLTEIKNRVPESCPTWR